MASHARAAERQVSRGQAAGWCRTKIQSPAKVAQVIRRLSRALEKAGYSKEDLFAVRLAVDEAIVNAIKHGHQGDTSKAVRVCYRITDRRVLVVVRDQGSGFDPDEVPDPLAPENLERSCGRGLLLMQHYMTWVRHQKHGTRVILCKYRSLLP